MLALSKPVMQHFPFTKSSCKASTLCPAIPLIDLSKPDAETLIINACEGFGFFKVINHVVPLEFISRLEAEAFKFFSLPLPEKEQAGPPCPFGYGNKSIGPNGDVGWVEYLLFTANQESNVQRFVSAKNPENFSVALNDYISAVKKMACEILELMAEGLKIQQKNVFSKLLIDEQSDSVFRLNHYPPCPDIQVLNGSSSNMIGFGEHTDPQIISVLRSNNTTGLQISLKDGSWISVPPDQNSFFINVGDSLQVLTNGRFKSVKHRVLANSLKSRVSMIYFGGPPLNEKIAPLPSLMKGHEQSLYKEFTWFEYKKSAYSSRLADNRLMHFEKIVAS
ncbi:gibberellin 2-beta-dioxygenase 1-like isoform X2 [Mangifera indica]|uniref:gibberellin 2-beta-dioxygenase 1-like isoform X2 n=1 Tax=Mangifera indica TaxID=29780 RepID=UPI001CF9CB8E|nr:gibberellin 2-beta-dioxygenase 1-like isoform X2 [Mangifera indica]